MINPQARCISNALATTVALVGLSTAAPFQAHAKNRRSRSRGPVISVSLASIKAPQKDCLDDSKIRGRWDQAVRDSAFLVEGKSAAPKNAAKSMAGKLAYSIVLRVTKCSAKLVPQQDRPFKRLDTTVAVELDGERIDNSTIAVAGFGEATVGAETNRAEAKLVKEGLDDALRAALGQATEDLVKKVHADQRPGRRKKRRSTRSMGHSSDVRPAPDRR